MAETGPTRQMVGGGSQASLLALTDEKQPGVLRAVAVIRSRLLEAIAAADLVVICHGPSSRLPRRLAKRRCRNAAAVTSRGRVLARLAGPSMPAAAAISVTGWGRAQRCIRLVTRLGRGNSMVICGCAFAAANGVGRTIAAASLPVKGNPVTGPSMRRRFSRREQRSCAATAPVIVVVAIGAACANGRV